MANLIAFQTGNFTASSSWATCDTSAELDSEASTVTVSTSNVDSGTFTPGAITVDGIALKMDFISSGLTGTFTITLRNSTDTVDVVSVTINAADFPVNTVGNGHGWIFFKFSANQLLIAAKAYLIRCVRSSSSGTVRFKGSSSTNYSRKLRTTTTAAPAVDDHLVISNIFTAAGASTAVTITMDNTATTSFGPTVSGGPPQGMVVSGNGTLTFGVAAATNYVLKLKGLLLIAGGGTVNIGTSGTRIPADSTAKLEFHVITNNDSGPRVYAGGTLNVYGALKTAIQTTLGATIAAAGTALTVADTTGWRTNDEIAFAPSGPAASISQFERKTISAIGSSTTATVGATSFAHTINSQFIGYVTNLTRSAKIIGTGTSLNATFEIRYGGITTCDSCELRYYSNNGIYMDSGGAITFTKSSFSDFASHVFNVQVLTLTAIFSFNCLYNITGLPINTAPAASQANTYANNWIFGMNINATAIQLYSYGNDVFKNNVILGRIDGIGSTLVSVDLLANTNFIEANWIGNIIGYSQSSAISISSNDANNARLISGSIKNLQCIHIINTDRYGISFGVNGPVNLTDFRIDTPTFIACNGGGIFPRHCWGNLSVNDAVFAGSSGVAATRGLYTLTQSFTKLLNLYFQNCTFGVATGSYVAHSTADLSLSDSVASLRIYMDNCNMASTTKISGLTGATGAAPDSFVRCARYGQVAGDHRSFFPYGNVSSDSTIFNTATPSERLTPSSATIKFVSSPKLIPVASAATLTPVVTVRKSVVGDGTAYNGNQPRLIARRYYSTGVIIDTVLATAAGAAGSWETLTGTTIAATDTGVMEFFVDCDGTAGWVNIDDWSI